MSHRKFMIFAIAAMLMLPLSNAFAGEDSPFSYGPIIGMNIANLTEDNYDNATENCRIGTAVGGFFTYSFNDRFLLQAEGLYSMKGIKLKYDDGSKGTIKIDYLEFPVLAAMAIPLNSIFTPRVYLGPAFSFLMSAKNVDDDGTTNIKNSVKSIDMGLVIGGGVNIEAGPGAVTIDARYNLGLLDVDDTEDSSSAKNSVISILVGYAF